MLPRREIFRRQGADVADHALDPAQADGDLRVVEGGRHVGAAGDQRERSVVVLRVVAPGVEDRGVELGGRVWFGEEVVHGVVDAGEPPQAVLEDEQSAARVPDRQVRLAGYAG